jgi:hypothetical protein
VCGALFDHPLFDLVDSLGDRLVSGVEDLGRVRDARPPSPGRPVGVRISRHTDLVEIVQGLGARRTRLSRVLNSLLRLLNREACTVTAGVGCLVGGAVVGATFGALGGGAGAAIGGGDSGKVRDAMISGAVGGVIGGVSGGLAGKGISKLI